MVETLLAGKGAALAAVALALGILALLWRGRDGVRGTTLGAPWVWAWLAVAAVAGSEVLCGLTAESSAAIVPLRFAAAMSTFCPLMAVLGAKRPQDRAWQFIVFALWIILCLPAAEWWLFHSGEPQEIHPARSWFLLALVGVAAVNYLPTRFWLSSLLVSAAQIAVLSDYLPWAGWGWRLPGAAGSLVGLGLALVAVALAVVVPPAARDPLGLDRAWLDFRDRFGALWALRVAERVNAAARMHGWQTRLAWDGFVPHTTEVDETVALSLKNLLRRFVSDRWLAERLPPYARCDSPIEIASQNE